MAEERKVEFAGNGTVKKCPNCGQTLDVFQARCPACGFAIGGEERGGSTALKNFLDVYTNEKDNVRKLEMIDTFPIPNTIEDTVEFALLAAQQVKSYLIRKEETGREGGDFKGFKDTFAEVVNGATSSKMITNTDFRIAWQNKLDQICYRAKSAYPQEKEKLAQLDMILDDVKNVDKETKKKIKKQSRGESVSFVLIFIVLLIIIFGCWYFAGTFEKKHKVETQRLETLMTEIQTDIAEGNYDTAELKLLDFRWTYDKDESQISIWEEKKALLVKQLVSKKKAGE